MTKKKKRHKCSYSMEFRTSGGLKQMWKTNVISQKVTNKTNKELESGKLEKVSLIWDTDMDEEDK